MCNSLSFLVSCAKASRFNYQFPNPHSHSRQLAEETKTNHPFCLNDQYNALSILDTVFSLRMKLDNKFSNIALLI